MLSLSRGGLIAAGAVCVIAPVVIAGSRGKVALASITAIAIAIVALFLFTPPEARQRVTESDNGNGREDIWRVGWRMSRRIRSTGSAPATSRHVDPVPDPARVILRDEYFIAAPKWPTTATCT